MWKNHALATGLCFIIICSSSLTVKAGEPYDKIAKFNEAAKTFVDLLKPNDLTKGASKILGGAGIVTSLLSQILGGEDAVKEQINAAMIEIRNSFAKLSQEVKDAVEDIKAYISKISFEDEVTAPAKTLWDEIERFYHSSNERTLNDLRDVCKDIRPRALLSTMNTKIQGGAFQTQNQADQFADAPAFQLSAFFHSLTKQLLVSAAVCEGILFPQDVIEEDPNERYFSEIKSIKEIEDRLGKETTDRKNKYWPSEVNASVEKILTQMKGEDSGANEKVAGLIKDKLQKDYQQWDDFLVGVYTIDGGNINHFFAGLEYELKKNFEGRNVFVFRRPKDAPAPKPCDMKSVYSKSKNNLPGEYLVNLTKKISKNCPAAKFVGVIREKANLGVSKTNPNMYFFENYHDNGFDLSVVIGWW